MKLKFILIIGVIAAVIFVFSLGFTENYKNGEYVGTITQFSKQGRFFKTYEGHLNVTQTGMNSGTGFDFSIDGDNEPAGIVARLDSAASLGWKVKLMYHQVKGKNWAENRGHTDFFVTDVIVLDKNFDKPFGNTNNGGTANNGNSGGIRDTIYVVIMPNNPDWQKFINKRDTIR